MSYILKVVEVTDTYGSETTHAFEFDEEPTTLIENKFVEFSELYDGGEIARAYVFDADRVARWSIENTTDE